MENHQSEIILKGRLNGDQRNRLARLLDMMYTPKELADTIGFNRRQIYRVYIHLGCPHEYSKDGYRLWINGKAFREWYLENYKKRTLGENETFCLTCKKVVAMVDPKPEQKNGLTFLRSHCPYCSRVCVRIIRNHRQQ